MEQMAPNLFIPGAARCGTTSLHAILGQHPDIHASLIKEPTYFNWPYQVIASPFAYFQLFASPKRYRLDASANYLASPRTPSVLRSLFPDARFIVMLRHPKARAYSLYRLMRYLGGEDITDFAEALKAEASRRVSHDFFASCRFDFWNYQYTRSSLYDEQLARYFTAFDRERFHITTLGELSKEPIATTERILRFLDLDPAPARHFNFDIKNRIEVNKPQFEAESDQLMSVAFEGLIERTDRLVGSTLDWSL